jgi:hypothetical protein
VITGSGRLTFCAAVPGRPAGLNVGSRKSPKVTAGVTLAGGKGPFHKFFRGGFARRGGEPKQHADGRVGEGTITADCGVTSEDDTVEWCSSAMPRSSYSESESESQNRPVVGRRTAAAVSISAAAMNGSRTGCGWRFLTVMRTSLARVEGAIVTDIFHPSQQLQPSIVVPGTFTCRFDSPVVAALQRLRGNRRRRQCGRGTQWI